MIGNNNINNTNHTIVTDSSASNRTSHTTSPLITSSSVPHSPNRQLSYRGVSIPQDVENMIIGNRVALEAFKAGCDAYLDNPTSERTSNIQSTEDSHNRQLSYRGVSIPQDVESVIIGNRDLFDAFRTGHDFATQNPNATEAQRQAHLELTTSYLMQKNLKEKDKTYST